MSRAWAAGSTATARRLRNQTLHRDRQCQIAGPNCTRVATEADHVINLAEGGPDTLANMQGLCHICHAEKTAAELARARQRAGKRPERKHPGLF